MQRERKPTTVSKTKQVGETKSRWEWVERSVWTQRMLKALETGVKGGKWFSLMDKIYSRRNLQAAYRKVRAGGKAAGVDHVTIPHFEQKLDEELEKAHEDLKTDQYEPQAIRRKYIDKPGSCEKRPLGIPTVRDRMVQRALLNAIEPIFEKTFADNSYGFRPGRGCKDALRHVLQKLEDGYYWVVDADVRSYFDRIPHRKLMERVEEKISDGRVLQLIEGFLKQGVLETMQHWKPEEGCPQGAVISPLLANIYLNRLDHLMMQEGIEMVRYADDLVLLCRSEEEAQRALQILQQWMESAELQLHPEKTRIVDLHEEGFDFLGYHFQAGRPGLPRIVKWPRKKSTKKLRTNLKPLTKRCNGRSLEAIIRLINPKLRGWYGYYQHSHPGTFQSVDGWVRGRLRAILRKRRGGRGRARGNDHHRWPNSYFHERGLFSLVAAHRSATQSSSR
jgi:RNA-directed DNA polymerase